MCELWHMSDMRRYMSMSPYEHQWVPGFRKGWEWYFHGNDERSWHHGRSSTMNRYNSG